MSKDNSIKRNVDWVIDKKRVEKLISEDDSGHKIYSKGFTVEVIPMNRADDAYYYLLTGKMRTKKSLKGVKWRRTESPCNIETYGSEPNPQWKVLP